jgi:hypothetical protein
MMERDEIPDPDAPPSAEEVAAAETLRDALGSGAPHPAADFARAVSLAHAPRPIGESEHRAIVADGVRRGDVGSAALQRRRARTRIAVAGGIALAAAVALVVGSPLSPRGEEGSARAVSVREPLVPVRSTQSLFREPFARTGGESDRIDRIASARASDLRANRFAAWGVR